MKLRYCDFCGEQCDGTNIIRSTDFEKTDGSDIIACNECLNLFGRHDWEGLTKRLAQCAMELK
jgi:ribosome-binding protein aMBF1 (putative translation factor)